MRKVLASGIIAFLGILALPDMMGFTGEQLYLTNSVYSVIAWIGLSVIIYIGWSRIDWSDRRGNAAAAFLALAFSVCMAVGSDLDSEEFITFGSAMRILSICCAAIPTYVLIKAAWGCLENRKMAVVKSEENSFSLKEFWITALLFVLCWLPIFLASYPGFFVYDAQEEVNEVLTRSFSTHHPLMHVLFLGGTVAALHKLTGSYNIGIACYMIVQMCIAAAAFSYMLYFLKKHCVSKKYRIVVFLFLALFPVISMYVLCSTKDTLFTIALLMQMIFMYEMLEDAEGFFSSWKQPLGLALGTFFMLSFRHNGVYAYVVFLVFLAWSIWKRRKAYSGYIKGMALMLVTPLLAASIVSMLLAGVLNADTSEKQEMLTVPIMQLARVYASDENAFSEADEEILLAYLPENALANYTPKLADNVKVYFNSERYSEQPGEFWGLWFRTGISHVGTYLNAWLYTSYGFWYPDTVIDVYSGVQRHTYIYEESSYFGYETEPPGTRESKLPWLDEIFRKMSLEIAQQKIPVISMLFSPGFMFWLFAFGTAFLWKQQSHNRLLLFGMPMLLWLTVLLGPTYAVRYVLIFWFACPMLTAMLFEKYTGFE